MLTITRKLLLSVTLYNTHTTHTGSADALQGLLYRAEATLSLTKTYSNNTDGLMLNTNRTQCILIGSRRPSHQTDANTHYRIILHWTPLPSSVSE